LRPPAPLKSGHRGERGAAFDDGMDRPWLRHAAIIPKVNAPKQPTLAA